jgi:hypothetical protein
VTTELTNQLLAAYLDAVSRQIAIMSEGDRRRQRLALVSAAAELRRATDMISRRISALELVLAQLEEELFPDRPTPSTPWTPGAIR